MGLHLKYKRRDGSEHTYEIGFLDTEIFLEYLGITEISLEPLRSMKRLRKLSLQDNHIETLDLSPLCSCTKIEHLSIGGNNLADIDLSPLRSMKNLSILLLNDNKLQDIKLIPLSSCKKLKYLNLTKNQISTQNLTPFCSSRDLHIAIDEDTETSKLLSEKTMKLSFFKDMGKILTNFDDLGSLDDIQLIKDIYPTIRKHEPNWKIYHLLFSALNQLNIDWLGLPDLNVKKTLKEIFHCFSFPDMIQDLQTSLISQVCKQIDDNIPIILLDTEKIKEIAELTTRPPRILEQRNEEMGNLVIDVSNGFVDLRPMWLTTYGHEVLSALALGTRCNLDDLKKVEEILLGLGFQLRIADDSNQNTASKLTKPLQEYIWIIADKNAKNQV
ncbi:MAG: hypothetical protein P1Q69_04200 [Candidatus Thorarchaeota archaeon]|nr:hypothetical protein [Candidatus Thorarchaeota archaeon]